MRVGSREERSSMKTLLLMRHAKSSWKQVGLADHERPLNKRGKGDAPRMGNLLWEKDLVPELILCSAALRARRTAEIVAEASGYDGDISYLDYLYGGEPSDFLHALHSYADEEAIVLVVGHNPDLRDLLETLTDEWERLPTAAIAHLSLPIDRWGDLRDDTVAELVQVWRPRELDSR
jgi:phosphohistidine phosphatase